MAMADIRDTRANIQCSLAAVYNIAMTSLILRLREGEDRRQQARDNRHIRSTHHDTGGMWYESEARDRFGGVYPSKRCVFQTI